MKAGHIKAGHIKAQQAWPIIDEHRIAIADLLVTLTDDDWREPSLCPGWTVRDVAGHLTQQIGPGLITSTVKAMVETRGGLNGGVAEVARRTAVRPVGALIADIRSMAGRRRAADNATWPYVLIDVLVHGQDIARPVGRLLPIPVDGAAEAATYAWKGMWRAPQRLHGFRLTADDTDWERGQGIRVSGSIDQLLLLITGRIVVVPELSGPGRADLARRLDVRL